LIDSLTKKGEEIKEKIQTKECEKKEVSDYNMDLDLLIEKNDNQISKMREERDGFAKTALTLDTFAKSFKKNIITR
jgi:DNA segregation ATPase FtsK/SpoIIIE-like protein